MPGLPVNGRSTSNVPAVPCAFRETTLDGIGGPTKYLKANVWLRPVSLTAEPTAQQSDPDAHVTPSRVLLWVVSVLGEPTIVHDVPSQRARSVCDKVLFGSR